MPPGRRAALLFNRTAGQGRGGRRFEAVAAALRAGFELELRPTESAAALRAAADDAAARGLDVVFVLGGDGTLRLAAGGLVGTPTALAPLPGGTTNVVACAAFGLPRDPVLAARALVDRGTVRTIDVGRFRAGNDDGLFLMQLSGGLDARVLAACDARAKRRFGKLAIAWAGVRVLAHDTFPDFELEVDGERARASGFVAANLAEYAGRFSIVPGARADDGVLDLLLYRGRSRRAAVGFAVALACGRHVARADVEIRRAERVALLSPSPAALQADGDPFVAEPPIDIRLSSRRLHVLAPTPPAGAVAGGAR